MDFGKIDERVKAIISAIVIIIVNVAALLGFQIDDGATLTNALLAVAAVISWAWAIWKNHNFTPEAAEAQQLLDRLKKEHKEARSEKE